MTGAAIYVQYPIHPDRGTSPPFLLFPKSRWSEISMPAQDMHSGRTRATLSSPNATSPRTPSACTTHTKRTASSGCVAPSGSRAAAEDDALSRLVRSVLSTSHSRRVRSRRYPCRPQETILLYGRDRSRYVLLSIAPVESTGSLNMNIRAVQAICCDTCWNRCLHVFAGARSRVRY